MRRTRDITFNRSEDKLTMSEYKISYSTDTPRNALSMGARYALAKFFFYPTMNQVVHFIRYQRAPVIISLDAFKRTDGFFTWNVCKCAQGYYMRVTYENFVLWLENTMPNFKIPESYRKKLLDQKNISWFNYAIFCGQKVSSKYLFIKIFVNSKKICISIWMMYI